MPRPLRQRRSVRALDGCLHFGELLVQQQLQIQQMAVEARQTGVLRLPAQDGQDAVGRTRCRR